MILNHIQPVLDPHLRPNQNTFRPGRMIEGVKLNNLPAVLLFLDFRKAFDSIHRDKMFSILKAYGLPNELIQVIKLLYQNARAKVLSPDGETDEFQILAGVLQGHSRSLFIHYRP